MNLSTVPVSDLLREIIARYRNVHPCNIDRAIYNYDAQDYVEIHDEEMQKKVNHVTSTANKCIDDMDIARFNIICREFIWLDFPKLALKAKRKSEDMYNIVKKYTDVFSIVRACIGEGDHVLLNCILSEVQPEIIYPVCRQAYLFFITFSALPKLEEIHAVLVKYANPMDHPEFEETILNLLECEDKKNVRMVYRFIVAHPEYKWQKRGEPSTTTLQRLTEIHLANMREILI